MIQVIIQLEWFDMAVGGDEFDMGGLVEHNAAAFFWPRRNLSRPAFLQLLCSSIIAIFSSVSLLANTYMSIQLQGKKLVGLPAEYQPAELDLTNHRLVIRDHVMQFSHLLESFLREPFDLKVDASWSREPEMLPPQLLLRVQPKGKDFSYELLFNLDTLELIELNVVVRESHSITRELPIALSAAEKQAISESIKTIR